MRECMISLLPLHNADTTSLYSAPSNGSRQASTFSVACPLLNVAQIYIIMQSLLKASASVQCASNASNAVEYFLLGINPAQSPTAQGINPAHSPTA